MSPQPRLRPGSKFHSGNATDPFKLYLSQKNLLDPTLVPLLDDYLLELSHSIKDLDNDIAVLQAAINAKTATKGGLEQERDLHAGMRSPFRSVPPELWGVIFGYVLGPEPFGAIERQTYNRLRRVCSSWRQVAAATPGLCTGLDIDMEECVGYQIIVSNNAEEAFKDYIAP